MLIISLSFSSCHAGRFNRTSGPGAEEKVFREPLGRKIGLLFQNRVVHKAVRKQMAKDRKLNREWKKSIKSSQKRTFDIQTPDVQKRMTEDKVKRDLRDKERIKKRKERFKKPQIKPS